MNKANVRTKGAMKNKASRQGIACKISFVRSGRLLFFEENILRHLALHVSLGLVQLTFHQRRKLPRVEDAALLCNPLQFGGSLYHPR